MLELLFSDSATAALMRAKKDGNESCDERTLAAFTLYEDGSTCPAEYEPTPYTGPTVDGSPLDVLGIWLVGSIGDIQT